MLQQAQSRQQEAGESNGLQDCHAGGSASHRRNTTSPGEVPRGCLSGTHTWHVAGLKRSRSVIAVHLAFLSSGVTRQPLVIPTAFDGEDVAELESPSGGHAPDRATDMILRDAQ